jgi:hypothetical protein
VFLEVADGSFHQSNVVPDTAKPNVASIAEQRAHAFPTTLTTRAACMIVIDRKNAAIRSRHRLADSASATLLRKHPLVVIKRQSITFPKVRDTPVFAGAFVILTLDLANRVPILRIVVALVRPN